MEQPREPKVYPDRQILSASLVGRDMIRREAELKEITRPIMKYLRNNCHPYTSIVITGERVTVIEDILSIPEGDIC